MHSTLPESSSFIRVPSSAAVGRPLRTQSIAAALPLGVLSATANALPLGSIGFGWVLPALAGLAGGLLLSRFSH